MRARLGALLVVLFAASLTAFAAPPPATVPPPKIIDAAHLPEPFGWPMAISSGIGSSGPSLTSLAIRMDLDLVAPLGNGSANAALWFRDFAKPDGKRLAEWNAAEKRLVMTKLLGVDNTKILPPSDPLLREAEGWADQAKCRFYPDAFALNGPSTAIPNLLMMMTLGRSWVARGLQTGNVDDLRRTVRLGRLLRQDDVTIIQDLIGIALIRMGSSALYDFSRAKGDTLQSTLDALVIAECNAIRLETVNRTGVLKAEALIDNQGVLAMLFGPSSRLRKEEAEGLIEMARKSADRRFRLEAMAQLYIIKHTGSGDAKKKATTTLDALLKDPDPIIAADARWYAKAPWNPKQWNLG